MSRLTIELSMSLDGHVAGPHPSQQYLGQADTVQIHVAPVLLGSGTVTS